jgi:hypothetical protein
MDGAVADDRLGHVGVVVDRDDEALACPERTGVVLWIDSLADDSATLCRTSCAYHQ